MVIVSVIGYVLFFIVSVAFLFSRMKSIHLTNEVTLLQGLVINLEQEKSDLEFKLAEASSNAIYDYLTGLVSRREFERLLNLDFARRQRLIKSEPDLHGNTTTLVFIDLDKFKYINDTFGHEAGDRVLACFGKFLRSFFNRSSDVACRFGGDEFVVLSTSIDPDNCQKTIEAFQRALGDFSVELPNGTLVKVNASLGCSLSSEHSDSVSLIREADLRMLAMKKGELVS